MNNRRSIKLQSAPTRIPVTKETGIIHSTEIPNTLKKAISIALNKEKRPPQIVPLLVAKGTNRAIKNNTNSGATTKLTTLITTSNKLPVTYMTKKLAHDTAMPKPAEIIFICRNSVFPLFCCIFLLDSTSC